MRKLAAFLFLSIAGLVGCNPAFAVDTVCSGGVDCGGVDKVNDIGSGGGEGSGPQSSLAGSIATGTLNMNGFAITNASGIAMTSPGTGVISTTNTLTIIGASWTIVIGSSLTFTRVGLTSTTTFKVDGDSVTLNGNYISTTNAVMIPFSGFNFVGVSSAIVKIDTSPYNGMFVFDANTSTGGGNWFVRYIDVPRGRNLFRDPILREFTVACASTTGSGSAVDDQNQTYTLTVATFSNITSVSTATFSNVASFTVSGTAAIGGIREATDVTLTGLAAKLGDGGCILALRFTRGGNTDASQVPAAFMGGKIQFFDYQ